MSTTGAMRARGFAIEPTVSRVGHALVSWAERREQRGTERRKLYRRQADAEAVAATRSAAVWGHMMP